MSGAVRHWVRIVLCDKKCRNKCSTLLPKSKLNRRRAFKGRGEKWYFGEPSWLLLLSSSKGMSVEGKGR